MLDFPFWTVVIFVKERLFLGHNITNARNFAKFWAIPKESLSARLYKKSPIATNMSVNVVLQVARKFSPEPDKMTQRMYETQRPAVNCIIFLKYMQSKNYSFQKPFTRGMYKQHSKEFIVITAFAHECISN